MRSLPITPFCKPLGLSFSCRYFSILLHDHTPQFDGKPSNSRHFSNFADERTCLSEFEKEVEIYFSHYESYYCSRQSPHLDDKFLDSLINTCTLFIAVNLQNLEP